MEKIEIIKKEVEDLLKKMIDKFEVEVEYLNDVYHVKIKADEEASIVIGKHGETIRSLQKILEVIFYKKFKEPINVLVNVNDFREKQKEKLEKLIDELAKKIGKEKKPLYINNLSAYERKLVHEYITKNYPHLNSYSFGEGKERRLVMELKKS
jgi:spoIIIJ-associated protein